MTIGIVAEGPRDFEIIESIVKLAYPDCICRILQPDDLNIATYNGWKGVWQWCINSRRFVEELSNVLSHSIDFYIIQLDGDTIREKYMHCNEPEECGIEPVSSAAYCKTNSASCPIKLNDEYQKINVKRTVEFLKERINMWINHDILVNVVKCVPVECPESWIVAAFDKNAYGSPELIENPADSVIGKSANYHNYRVNRKDGKLKKAQRLYTDFLIPKLCLEWELVKSLCLTAELFQADLDTCIMRLVSRKPLYCE